MTFPRWQAPLIGPIAGILIGAYGPGEAPLGQGKMVLIGGVLGLIAGVVIFFIDRKSDGKE